MLIIVVNWNSFVMLFWVIFVFVVNMVIGLESLLVVCVKFKNICLRLFVIIVSNLVNFFVVFRDVFVKLVVFICFVFEFVESCILIWFLLFLVLFGVMFKLISFDLFWIIRKLSFFCGLFLMVWRRLWIDVLCVLRRWLFILVIMFLGLIFVRVVVEFGFIMCIIILGRNFCLSNFIVIICLKRIV